MNTEPVPYNYQITLEGAIAPDWADWLGVQSLRTQTTKNGMTQTLLTGPLPDQSALRGLLIRIWDLNLELVALKRTAPERKRRRI